MYLAYVFYFPFVSPIFRASSLPTSSISRRSSTPPSTFHSLLIPPLIFAVSSEPGYSEIQIDSRARDKSYFPLKNRSSCSKIVQKLIRRRVESCSKILSSTVDWKKFCQRYKIRKRRRSV